MLKEVLNIRPFAAPHGKAKDCWYQIATNMCSIYGEGAVSDATCKARYYDIMKAFKKDEMESLQASGTEEEYTEREELLNDIKDLVWGYRKINTGD